MSKIQEIKSYTPPILHMGKDWYIDFYAFNPVDGVMKRKKIKLNFIKSVKERRAYAKGCINRLSEKLATGWNPWIEQECGNAFLLFKDVIDKYRTFLAKMQRALLDTEAKAAAISNKRNVILNFEKEIKKASYRDEADAESIASARASRIAGITEETSPDDLVD